MISTQVADTFCHLYVLAAAAQEDLRRYMRAMRLPLAKRLPVDARADVAMKRDRALAKARNVAAAIRPFASAPASPVEAPAPAGDVEAQPPSEEAPRPSSRARPATRGALRATLRAGSARSTPSFSRSVRRATQRGQPATPFSRVARVAPAAIFEEGDEDEAV